MIIAKKPGETPEQFQERYKKAAAEIGWGYNPDPWGASDQPATVPPKSGRKIKPRKKRSGHKR